MIQIKKHEIFRMAQVSTKNFNTLVSYDRQTELTARLTQLFSIFDFCWFEYLSTDDEKKVAARGSCQLSNETSLIQKYLQTVKKSRGDCGDYSENDSNTRKMRTATIIYSLDKKMAWLQNAKNFISIAQLADSAGSQTILTKSYPVGPVWMGRGGSRTNI